MPKAKALFTASQFTPTEWSSAEEKAKFANHFVRLVESGFKETMFQKWFYTRMSKCFGHIAHYNQGGFYNVWFTNTENQLAFLKHCLQGGGYGSPEFTYSDVERSLKTWIREMELILKMETQISKASESSERAQLAALKAKYEGVS